jgi:hypothetical protein
MKIIATALMHWSVAVRLNTTKRNEVDYVRFYVVLGLTSCALVNMLSQFSVLTIETVGDSEMLASNYESA